MKKEFLLSILMALVLAGCSTSNGTLSRHKLERNLKHSIERYNACMSEFERNCDKPNPNWKPKTYNGLPELASDKDLEEYVSQQIKQLDEQSRLYENINACQKLIAKGDEKGARMLQEKYEKKELEKYHNQITHEVIRDENGKVKALKVTQKNLDAIRH